MAASRSQHEWESAKVGLPTTTSFEAFERAWISANVNRYFLNSLFVTIVTIVLSVAAAFVTVTGWFVATVKVTLWPTSSGPLRDGVAVIAVTSTSFSPGQHVDAAVEIRHDEVGPAVAGHVRHDDGIRLAASKEEGGILRRPGITPALTLCRYSPAFRRSGSRAASSA